MSFNDQAGVFVSGPQFDNYALYKLRIYAFSKETDLAAVLNTPFQTDNKFQIKDQNLSSPQLQKLLS